VILFIVMCNISIILIIMIDAYWFLYRNHDKKLILLYRDISENDGQNSQTYLHLYSHTMTLCNDNLSYHDKKEGNNCDMQYTKFIISHNTNNTCGMYSIWWYRITNLLDRDGISKCDWACENRACGHKLHPITLQVITQQWNKIFTFCDLWCIAN